MFSMREVIGYGVLSGALSAGLLFVAMPWSRQRRLYAVSAAGLALGFVGW